LSSSFKKAKQASLLRELQTLLRRERNSPEMIYAGRSNFLYSKNGLQESNFSQPMKAERIPERKQSRIVRVGNAHFLALAQQKRERVLSLAIICYALIISKKYCASSQLQSFNDKNSVAQSYAVFNKSFDVYTKVH